MPFVCSIVDKRYGSKQLSVLEIKGVTMTKKGERTNYITANDHVIYIVPGSSHLLKNLRGAMLAGTMKIPEDM